MAARALTLTKLDMDEALASGQIQLAYQPIFSLHDGHLARIEALVRWEHPRLGTMLPDAFLPAFEAENRLLALTRRVLERAAAEFASWAFAAPTALSINLSARDLCDPSLPSAVRSVIDAVSLDPEKITFECPVSGIDEDAARQVLSGLRDLGVLLAAEMIRDEADIADAFALAPFNEVKTSGRGIMRATRNNHTAALTGAADLIAYAHSQGAIVTALGAEDETECLALRTVGFDQAQANVLAPALPIDGITAGMAASARLHLGFDDGQNSSAAEDSVDAPIQATSSFYHERRRAQGEILRRAAEKRIEDEAEAALLSGRGIRAVQSALGESYGEEIESDDDAADGLSVREQQEALMQEAESKAGLLMRPDLAAASLGYGASPLRPAPKRSAEDTRNDVARAISDVLESLPAEISEREDAFEDIDAQPEISPEDQLDAEVAKLPALDDDDIAIMSGNSPVHDELHDLASRLRAQPVRKKNFLERKYKLRVTHFWPKPWKRAYLRHFGPAAGPASAVPEDVLEPLSGKSGEQDSIPMVSLGADNATPLVVTVDQRPTPRKKRSSS